MFQVRFSVKVETYCSIIVCVHSAWKGRPRNDLYCVGWDVKPYSLLLGLLHVIVRRSDETKSQENC